MNSNEDELQKAINDITNNMLNETPVAPAEVAQPEPAAPVAPEPVAAEPAAPAMSETSVEEMKPPVVAPLPDAPNLQPVAPETSVAPETPVAPEVAPEATEAPAVAEPAPAESAPEMATPEIPELSTPAPAPVEEPVMEVAAETEVVAPETETKEEPQAEPAEEVKMDFNERMEVEPGGVKEKALRDLMPILGKMNNVEAEKKFKVYCDMMEALDEKEIANDAYEVATQIGDDNVRGEALLKLVDLLDK